MKFSIDKKLIFVLLLWLLLWAGYNTYPQKLDFSNFLIFFHGIRAYFPILAGVLAVIFLLKQPQFSFKILKTPVGFLIFYTLIGIVSSIFLSAKPQIALYWAISYFSVLAVLLLVNSSLASSLINLNWIIVFIVAIGLFGFFLSQPGVISSLTSNFLGGRPYESLAGVPAEIKTFGMTGTRPTGLGRYAGVVALFTLARTILTKERKKFFWYLLFLISFSILIFSQARTAVLGFVFASFLIFLLKSKTKTEVFGYSFFSLIHFFLVFLFLFYIPLFYSPNLIEKTSQLQPLKFSEPTGITKPIVVTPFSSSFQSQITIFQPTQKMQSILTTLSGRITWVWPENWRSFLKSPLIGRGFHADRIFPEGRHPHNAILHALIQTGLIGTIPFILAFIWSWILFFKLFKISLEKEKPFLIEIAGIFAFFTIRGIAESTGAFFGADWILLAPLLAYIQNLWFKKTQLNS